MTFPAFRYSSLRSAVLPLFAVVALAVATPNHAAELASELLPMPLAPEMSDSLKISMPNSFDPEKPTWVAYQLFAVSPTDDPEGEVVVTGMFEGELTPAQSSTVLFEPRDLHVAKSGGTIQAQFEANFGKRSESELRAMWGDAMYDAYVAANAGTGRLLDGIANRTLPPLTKGEPVLLVTVERASGIQPAGLLVTVGQGEIPAHLQPNVEASGFFQLGLGLGKMLPFLLLLGAAYVVYRVVQSKREA